MPHKRNKIKTKYVVKYQWLLTLGVKTQSNEYSLRFHKLNNFFYFEFNCHIDNPKQAITNSQIT